MVGLEGLSSKSTESDKKKNTVSADRVGNTRIPVAIVDGIVHPVSRATAPDTTAA